VLNNKKGLNRQKYIVIERLGAPSKFLTATMGLRRLTPNFAKKTTYAAFIRYVVHKPDAAGSN